MWYENRTIMYVYFTLLTIFYAGFLFSYLGWNYLTFHELTYVRMSIQVLVAIVLLLRFHPWRPFRNHILTQDDVTLIFASASILMINVLLEQSQLSKFLLEQSQWLLTKGV